jgi:CrcB protein
MEFAFNRPSGLITPTEFLQEGSVVSAIPNYLSTYIWIGVGAVVGASARYFLSTVIARDFVSAFPYGTLLINITGSLVLGFFLVFSTERALLDPRWRLLLAVGFCGSYTTFSSYAFESFALMERGHWLLSGINIVASNALCLAAVLAGAVLARAL